MPDKQFPQPAELLATLLKINSFTGNEKDIALFLYDFLNTQFECDLLELQEVEKDRFNIIMRAGSPVVTLTTHMDTVPGFVEVKRNHNNLYGRGACDAKGQIAAQLAAMHRVVDQGRKDVACFFVIGEEVDSIGATAAARHPAVGSKYLLNGEPTGNRFVKSSKGVIDFIVASTGNQMHSSSPGAQSATHVLITELAGLLEKNSASFHINIGAIEAKGSANVSCHEATARVCIRIGHSVEHGLQILDRIFKTCKVELSGVGIEPFDFYVPGEFEQNSFNASFCSDSPLYAGKFEHIMMFGPGDISEAHTNNEYINLDALEEAIGVLEGLFFRLGR